MRDSFWSLWFDIPTYFSQGLPLLLGVTSILLVGNITLLWQKYPQRREKIAEWTLLSFFVFLALPFLLGISTFDVFKTRQGLINTLSVPRKISLPMVAIKETASHSLSLQSPSTFKKAEGLSPESETIDEILGFPDLEAEYVSSENTLPHMVTVSPSALPLSLETTLPETSIAPEISKTFTWRHGVVAFLVIGACFVIGWLIIGHLTLVRFTWKSSRADGPLAELFATILSQAKIRKTFQPIRLLVFSRANRPFTFGVFRPTIVLPIDYAQTKSKQVLRHILLHELGHIQSRDALRQCVMNLAYPLLFAHPCYWWLRRQVIFDQELLADQWATRRCEPLEYVGDLISIAKNHLSSWNWALVTSPVSNIKYSYFFRRMKMLVNEEKLQSKKCSPLWSVGLSFGTLATLTLVITLFGLPYQITWGQTRHQERSQSNNAVAEVEMKKNTDTNEHMLPSSEALRNIENGVEEREKDPSAMSTENSFYQVLMNLSIQVETTKMRISTAQEIVKLAKVRYDSASIDREVYLQAEEKLSVAQATLKSLMLTNNFFKKKINLEIAAKKNMLKLSSTRADAGKISSHELDTLKLEIGQLELQIEFLDQIGQQ